MKDLQVNSSELLNDMKFDKKGKPLATIENFLIFMCNDKEYQDIRFNELTNQAEIHKTDSAGNLTIIPWSDTERAESLLYMEKRHDFYDTKKHDEALRLLFALRRYNPLRDLVDSFKWDGINRCELFFIKWLKAEDSPYLREVSRLFFAGGINRLYSPGCKFDDVLVLIGPQGSGKTLIVQLLALNENYYSATKYMRGDPKSIEQIFGAWIVEIPELAAFKNSDIESLKAFVTQTADKYRKPWDREVSTLPRRCIFIGTGNNRQFLSDKTGNRRFYPIYVRSDGYEVFKRREEIQSYIVQCWAEARERYKAGNMPPVADPSLAEEYQKRQANAMEDDWRIGQIEQFLSTKSKVGDLTCAKEIFEHLYSDSTGKTPSRTDSLEIGQIMDSNFSDWERLTEPERMGTYGKQRGWKRVSISAEESEELEQLPFN